MKYQIVADSLFPSDAFLPTSDSLFCHVEASKRLANEGEEEGRTVEDRNEDWTKDASNPRENRLNSILGVGHRVRAGYRRRR